ncbi:MAG: hypothetical protein HY075_04160, partial [Deltaproteobacteria bacterium]|nr:hypothetical protein [Deltaproteobacteria bacterium]
MSLAKLVRASVVVVAGFLASSCGGLFEVSYNVLNEDSVQALGAADPKLCSIIQITNKVRTAIDRNGDSVVDTNDSREIPLLRVRASYKIFNSENQSLHVAAVAQNADPVPYGGGVELRVEFDENNHPELLKFPYYKADILIQGDIRDDGVDSLGEVSTIYTLNVEKGEGRCGSTYAYTAWNRARDAMERGQEPGAQGPVPSTSAVAVSTGPVTPPPEQPGFNVELPYESGLSISGRKLIALQLKETRHKSAKRAREQGFPKIQHEFNMKQELQVRIKGKVGRKITVNVDFDDTKEDKRDISV